jgi:hypothetical protein
MRLEIVDICHLETIASSWLLSSSEANHHARHKGLRNMLAQCRFGMSLGVHHTRLGGGQPKSGVCTHEFNWQIALRTRRSRSRPSPRAASSSWPRLRSNRTGMRLKLWGSVRFRSAVAHTGCARSVGHLATTSSTFSRPAESKRRIRLRHFDFRSHVVIASVRFSVSGSN